MNLGGADDMSDDDQVVKIPNRRKRRPAEKFQFWLNVVAVALLAVPMLIESLKGFMAPNFYGWASSIFAVLNAGIGIWRLHVNRGQVRVD